MATMLVSFTLRMTRHGDNTIVPYKPALPTRAIEIVQDIFAYEKSIRYIDSKQLDDTLRIVILTDLGSAIVERLNDIFIHEAADTWMEGDITLDGTDDELHLDLESEIRQLVTFAMVAQAPLDQLNNVLINQGYAQQSDIQTARHQVKDTYRRAKMLYPESW